MPGDELRAAVNNLPVGWSGKYFASLGSTQDAAREAVRAGAPGGSIFVADYQTAGRGRQGRAWLAPPGSALMLSLVFRDAASTPLRWTTLASVALVEAILDVEPDLEPAIKWPNDVVLNDRKVAGVLAETTWDGVQLVAIVGMGVNVNTGTPDLLPMATSLRLACGHPVDRGQLLHAFVRHLEIWLARPAAQLHEAWQSRLWGRGQRLRLVDLGREEEVVVLGADLDGSLRVRLPDGTERTTTTGELIL